MYNTFVFCLRPLHLSNDVKYKLTVIGFWKAACESIQRDQRAVELCVCEYLFRSQIESTAGGSLCSQVALRDKWVIKSPYSQHIRVLELTNGHISIQTTYPFKHVRFLSNGNVVAFICNLGADFQEYSPMTYQGLSSHQVRSPSALRRCVLAALIELPYQIGVTELFLQVFSFYYSSP